LGRQYKQACCKNERFHESALSGEVELAHAHIRHENPMPIKAESIVVQPEFAVCAFDKA
jgi:hypothetical protein